MTKRKSKYHIFPKGFLVRKSSLGFLFFLLSACSQASLFEENVRIHEQHWNRQQVPEFQVHMSQPHSKMDVYISMRHSSKYKYANLALIVEEITPANKKTSYSVRFPVSDSEGRWLGTGAGNILNYQIPFLKDHHFTDTGLYSYRIRQNMSINPLPDVLDVGLKIQVAELLHN